MNSCIYEGWVRHRRYLPKVHAFRYRMFMMFLDLDELDEVFGRRIAWSSRRFAPAWFRRRDHVGDPDEPLGETIRAMIETSTGSRPQGPIRLLTHLRYFGYCMNPVCFYYCYDRDGIRLETIVAEVHNTPWGETHCYVLAESMNRSGDSRKHYRFPKFFHVSPFMNIDQEYDWRFTVPGKRLVVHMDNIENGNRMFDASMSMRRTEISTRSLGRVLVRYPLMTLKVIAAIYYQALRLYVKRCPYFHHPRDRMSPERSD